MSDDRIWNAWVIRPYPHLMLRMREFIDKQIIAIGWPNIGDLTGLPPHKIEKRNRTHHPGRDDKTYSLWTSTICRFRDEMKVGDLVISAPKKSDAAAVSIGVVDGRYAYNPDCDGEIFGYPHQRSVRWLRHDVPRSRLPIVVQKSLRSQGTLFRTKAPVMEEYCREQGWL